MSDREGEVMILKIQRSILRTERDMYAGYIARTPKTDRNYSEYRKTEEALQKDLNRISHRLRNAM